MNKYICILASAALLAASAPLGAQVTPPPAPIPPASGIDTSYVTYDEGPVTLPLGIGIPPAVC